LDVGGRSIVSVIVVLVFASACASAPGASIEESRAAETSAQVTSEPTTEPSVRSTAPRATTVVAPEPIEPPVPSPTPVEANVVTRPEEPVPTSSSSSTISRAGEGCSIVPAGNSPISEGYFDVPNDMTAINCRLLEYGFDGTAVGCCVSPITVEMSISSPTRVADRLVADAASFQVLERTLSSISGQPAWLFEVELQNQAGAIVQQRWLLLSLRWYTLAAVASDDRADIDPARTWASFDELVDSVRVTRIRRDKEPNVVVGGRCSGERWTVDVPDGWFHTCADGHEIVHLNSSPVSDIAMQCECLGPLWIGDRPFNNYGSTDDELVQEVFNEQSSERLDGTPITIRDYRWGDNYIGTRLFRTVTVHFDDHDVSVTANETTEHTGPFGTWEDTLWAQDALVNSVRSHS